METAAEQFKVIFKQMVENQLIFASSIKSISIRLFILSEVFLK